MEEGGGGGALEMVADSAADIVHVMHLHLQHPGVQVRVRAIARYTPVLAPKPESESGQ